MTRRITVRSGSVPRKVAPPAAAAILLEADVTDLDHATPIATHAAIVDSHHTKYTDTEAAAKIAADALYLPVAGGTMAGTLDMDGNPIVLPVKTTTGDPASPVEGQIYVNTFDNTVRVYADGAWHDLATW